MATRKTKSKARELPTRENGDPDIVAYCEEFDVKPHDAADAYGISHMRGYKLFWAQEVEDDPSLKVKPATRKDRSKLGAAVVAMREDGMRWEKIQVRTDMSKAELMELYEEVTGEEPKRLRGGVAEEDEAPAPAKAKRNGGKTSRKAKAAPVEDEGEDEAEAEEAPAPRRRAKARK